MPGPPKKTITRNLFHLSISAVLIACLSLNCGASNISDLHPELLFLYELENTATLTISNASNGTVLESGVLIGTATGNVAAVEVQLDGGSFQAAEGTESWSFRLPTGSDIWRNGTEHTVVVRVRSGLGLYSSQSSLTLRKGVNNDINGDGFADLVVGAALSNSFKGGVFIYPGSKDGVNDSTDISGINDFEFFGYAVTLGDINADGYADLVVGATGTNENQGRVYIFSGGENGVSASDSFLILDGIESGGLFGSKLLLGDINADGYADLVVSALEANEKMGSVYIFPGAATGIRNSTPSITLNGDTSESNYGNTLALGDMNGDGFADLAVSAPFANTNRGSVYLYSGNMYGVSSSAFVVLEGAADNNKYGGTLELGDLNGDGYAELVVGAPGANSDKGRAYIYSGGLNSVDSSSEFVVFEGIGESVSFASVLKLGDLNGDGFAELIIGAPGAEDNSEPGNVYIFSKATNNVSSFISYITLSGDLTSEKYGSSLALGDLNGDGFSELIVGNTDVSAFGGDSNIRLYQGAAEGLSSYATPLLTIEGESGSFFGWSLAP